MAVTERLDRFQRKHPWAAFPLAVAYKYFDDFGAYLAALLTYYGFVSLFPLLLLLSTILGFVLSGDQRLQHEVLTSAVHQFPVIGGDLARPKRLGGGRMDRPAHGMVSLGTPRLVWVERNGDYRPAIGIRCDVSTEPLNAHASYRDTARLGRHLFLLDALAQEENI